MTVTIVPIYAAICGFLLIYLSVRVIRARRLLKVPLGEGDQPAIRRAMRAQGNFIEYAPLALILITLAEMQGYPGLIVHGLGLALVAGRLVHAYGLSQENENYRFRTAGMALTFATIGAAAALDLIAGIVLRF